MSSGEGLAKCSFKRCQQSLVVQSLVSSNSLHIHGLQHARISCSLIPRVCSNSCPSSWWSNHLILCRPLLLLPSIFPSIRVFSNESVLHIRWPKYWSFSISPSNEYSGLIFFRIDWFDLSVQGTLRESSSTPQFKSINSSALSFLYGPIHDYWKNIALTRWTFAGKVMSLCFLICCLGWS